LTGLPFGDDFVFAFGDLVDLGLIDRCFVGHSGDCVGVLEEGFAWFGEMDASAGALEELDAEFGFESLDLGTESRLRDVELAGGVDEAERFGHGAK
jgi:hypothetical protein